VRSDLPHFTYLGVEEHLLPSLGLKMVRSGGRVFWIPDFECPPTTRAELPGPGGITPPTFVLVH
jgi:hypothetical protein